VDDELIEEVLGLYRHVRDHNEAADDDTLVGLIMWDLRECEILELATDALSDDATGVDTTRDLAMTRIRRLIHAFKKYNPNDGSSILTGQPEF